MELIQNDKLATVKRIKFLCAERIDILNELIKIEKRPTRIQAYKNDLNKYNAKYWKFQNYLLKNSPKSTKILLNEIHIKNGSYGHSYNSLFGQYLATDIEIIEIYEPYLREHYQLINLTVLLELILKKCPKLKYLNVTTKLDDSSVQNQRDQKNCFSSFIEDFHKFQIYFTVKFQKSLHHRQIILSNGFQITIQRGLHFFDAPHLKYCLGLTNYEFRTCRKTTVSIYSIN